jgi:hypothetical protein
LKKDIAISLFVSAGLGAVIWALSQLITGKLEPWDAESPYYFVALLFSGIIVGALIPKHVWAVLVGIVTGQLIYALLFLPLGPLVGIGTLIMVLYGFISLVGAIFAARIRGSYKNVKIEV